MSLLAPNPFKCLLVPSHQRRRSLCTCHRCRRRAGLCWLPILSKSNGAPTTLRPSRQAVAKGLSGCFCICAWQSALEQMAKAVRRPALEMKLVMSAAHSAFTLPPSMLQSEAANEKLFAAQDKTPTIVSMSTVQNMGSSQSSVAAAILTPACISIEAANTTSNEHCARAQLSSLCFCSSLINSVKVSIFLAARTLWFSKALSLSLRDMVAEPSSQH
eukprot:UN1584